MKKKSYFYTADADHHTDAFFFLSTSLGVGAPWHVAKERGGCVCARVGLYMELIHGLGYSF